MYLDWLNNALNVQKFPISKLTPHQYAKRLAYSVLDNGIFIGGDEQRSHRLYRYAEKHYARAMR
ncbi:hypothetical protein YS65_003285 [Salmonella enterica subsp. enterica]|uniref:Uncharacterized protein n=1 Tax=Salmonella newport TaxID=108619 RepID=A0A5X8Y034_SALNE|nr:hypothetical protein [Salmonella enterica]EBS2908578.1 hypothetical protein [Salmonella enterica subsp. enterica serovar Flottbek]EBS4086127.1 hypothetical protein [Salmonella enterica subsp. enterica serovar Newport]ECC9721180.1 hypothetical protein [Salmonella enterica subsp. diarizonae]EDI2556390.1 hypothetical protein [Salmonella enterica subsp. enterica serovar Ajiobo]EDP8833905.1 hypothetical protein [Salmonella enterica subsp. enterica]EEE4104264.1 hypothetical protein [Salmonella e